MKRLILAGLFVLFMVGSPSAVVGGPIEDRCDAVFSPDNTFIEGWGSGWNGGEWISYPSGWWNQWFYNAPLDTTRWKRITYGIVVGTETPGSVEWADIAINWSFEYYDNDDSPPGSDDYIVRELVYSGDVGSDGQEFMGEIIILDYNPAWVSIDVMTSPVDGVSNIRIFGWVEHECIPEPATLVLLGLGGLLLRRRKR